MSEAEKSSKRVWFFMRWFKRKRVAEEPQNDDAPEEVVEKPSARKERSPIYLAVLLGGFSLIGAACLASGFDATEAAIAERQKEDLLTSLALVVPARTHDNDLVANAKAISFDGAEPRTIYFARNQGEVTGVAFEVVGQGYGGAIRILMGVDRDGTILGVRVLQHAETPGLGDRVEAAKSDWVNGFEGTSLTHPDEAHWAVKKDGGQFDQFSGATITPRAVVKAVHEGLVFFRAHRDQLISSQGATT